jgi:hypothetical protein
MTDRIRTKRKKDGLVQSSNLLEGGKQSVAFPGNSLTATKNGHDFSNLGDQNKSKGIDDFEVFLERVAHDIVYHDSLTPQDKEFLRTMGYQANPSAILYGKHGLQFLALHVVRENHNLKPILAFRGTDFSLNFREVIADWKTNLGLQQTEGLDQIGEAQFHSNQALIEKIIDGFSEKVIVTGHSLGGALAQITACAYPDRVSRIVTFQSPGINKEGVQKLNDHNKESKPNEMIDSTHYRVKGDIPHNFGEAMTPGSIYEFVVEGGDPHGAFPLRSSKFVPASVRRKSPINTSEEVREPAYEAARRTIPDFSIPTSREDFLVDGVKQGVSGLYKTLNNSMEWAITGDPTKLLEQYDRQRKLLTQLRQ